MSLLTGAISSAQPQETTESTTNLVDETPELSQEDILNTQIGGEEPESTEDSSSLEAGEVEDSSEDSDDQPTSEENIEYITAKDHRGQRRKIKVDYSDRDKIKRAFSLAAGARKWQAERDSLAKELESFKGEGSKKIENWDTISSIYEDQGVKGLVNFLEGRDDAFDQLINNANKEREFFSQATPEQLEAYNLKQAQAQKDRELEKIKAELEELRNAQSSTSEEAELASIRSEINPVFEKYRFAGKLNNPQHEHMLDEMLWNNAMKQLESYPEDMDVTQATINKVFKDYANNLRTLVNKEAEKKVSRTVAKKKREATQAAQTKAVKNMGSPSSGETVQGMIKEGRVGDLFKYMASRNKNFVK